MNRSALIRFGIALVIFLGTIAGYYVWSGMLQGAQTADANLTTNIHKEETSLADIHAAQATLALLANEEATTSARFVSDAGIVTFLSSLESTGHAIGATVSIVSVNTQQNTTAPMLSIALTATGSFDAVMRTVGAIENAPYYVAVPSLTLTHVTAGVSKKTTRWTAQVILAVGYAPGSATTTPAS